MPKTFTPRPYQDLIIKHEIDISRCNIWAGSEEQRMPLRTIADNPDHSCDGSSLSDCLHNSRTNA